MLTGIEQKLSWAPALQNAEILHVPGADAPLVILRRAVEVEVADFAFRRVARASSRLEALLRELDRAGSFYCVFGGWLRDTLAARLYQTPEPRDVDLVASGIDLVFLIDRLPSDVQPTLFGGVQSGSPPVPFDVWPLNETFLLKRLRLPATFETLIRTADFNINSGLYFPEQRGRSSMIIDGGMLAALARREIAFSASELPFPLMQCARLAAYATKLDFSLSSPVLAFMRGILFDHAKKAEVLDGLLRHQPKVISRRASALVEAIAKEIT